ncbi:hypothetical protein [Alicyclobacillus ferrooxydans]|uniref:hypothetical protein n=1 Tax=Alicyclobacillus ferrooxydans TaxID=471514 RepID=UPI001FE03369|nr:hypothetical protein [Alicyclobacillus ferrooxydans]
MQNDWAYVDRICSTFEDRGGQVYLVELEADLEVRLERNKTPHPLEHKPSKRDVKRSEHDLKLTAEKHRLNSVDGEITRENLH